MEQTDDIRQEVATLRERLSRLSDASLRINESLDIEQVLPMMLDSACSLTDARYGVIVLLDESGQIQDFIAHGVTAEQARMLWEIPDGETLFEYLIKITGPLRLPDFHSFARSQGLPPFRPPMPVSSALSFLAMPIFHGGDRVGGIFVGEKEGGQAFSQEDEETLVMFASHAALVIANARRYRDEQRARKDIEALIDTSPVGVIVFDARTGDLVSVNREVIRIVSDLMVEPTRTLDQLLEVIAVRRSDGTEVTMSEIPMPQALSVGETVRAEEIVIRIPEGRSITTLMNATPILSDDGEVETFVVTLQDMKPLDELDRMRVEFLGMVSHELQAPLASIRGSAITLLSDEANLDPAEMRQFHRIIEQESRRMRGLISDLLDVARVRSGTLSVSAAHVDIAGLVDEARNAFLSSGDRNDIRIDLASDLPPVMVDRRRIVQVLGNLLSNAARYSPESSIIRVEAERKDLHVAISVIDEGRGVSAERLPHLFRNFSRVDGEDWEGGFEGSGLGLAICKGIVEAHGGRIWAESDGPGLGSRFTFTVPAVEDAIAASSGPSRRSSRQGGTEMERSRILAVDDDPQMLRYLRDTLSRAGYQPIVTGDPEEVLQLVESERPHLVLLDLMLPGTDGIVLMRSILDKADVPVIFLSAYGQDEVIVRAFEMGAIDYVVKPFSPTELVARIGAALRMGLAPGRTLPLEPYVLGDLKIDYQERRVTVARDPVRLTATEYDLLFELSVNGGRVMTHEQLLRLVWGDDDTEDARPVRTVVKNLRQKMGDSVRNPAYIFTEPRVGYRMPKSEGPLSEVAAMVEAVRSDSEEQ